MLFEILKALLVGVCVAVPIGPVLLLVMQKTVYRGRWAGVATGLGSGVIDTLYAAIGLFTLSFLEDFLLGHEDVIMLVGGALVALIGIRMMLMKGTKVKERPDNKKTMAGYALQTAGCVLSNPAALVTAFALLAFFGLSAGSMKSPVWLAVLCVFIGEMAYWLALTFALTHFKRFSARTVETLSRLAGAGIFIFGIVLVIKGLLLIL